MENSIKTLNRLSNNYFLKKDLNKNIQVKMLNIIIAI